MRITHTIFSLRPELGGPSVSAPALCVALAEQGGDVDMAVWEERGERRPLDEKNGITRNDRVPPVMVNGGIRRKQLVSHVANNDIEILHDHSIWRRSHIDVALASRQTGRPLVLSPRGTLLPWCLQHKRLKKKMGMMLYMRRVLEQVALFHATSEEEVESLRSAGFRQPITLIPNGTVLPDLDSPIDGDEFGYNGDRTALFISRINPKKGLLMLVRAWGRLRPLGWRLKIVGPDENNYRGEIATAIEREGLTDVVTIRDAVDHKEKWMLYRAADLFVLPTHSENFGIVVGEALAAGTPVLTTKGAPWAELETYQCGWWTDISVDAIFHALQEATALSADELRMMGKRGRSLVEERYSWQAIGRDMLRAYEWLLGKEEMPDTVFLY